MLRKWISTTIEELFEIERSGLLGIPICQQVGWNAASNFFQKEQKKKQSRDCLIVSLIF